MIMAIIKTITETMKKSLGIICLLSGGYGLWFCATGDFDDDIESLPDYDYIAEIRGLEKEGRLGEAEQLADFVLEGTNVIAHTEVQSLRDNIYEKRTGFWRRAYRAGKGFVVGDGASAEELGGAVVSDFLLWGDIRDLAKQGYCKVTGKETDPVVAALASVGVLTSLASFWVADPAEPAEVAADASLSFLKTLRKMGNLSKRFCGTLVDACRETAKTRTASKGLKELVVGIKNLFDGVGAARAAAIMKHVDDIPSLKAVSTMAKKAPESTAILVRMHGEKGVKLLGTLSDVENGAIVLEKAARKGPKAIAKLMIYVKNGVRTWKSFLLGHPQGLVSRLLGRKTIAITSMLVMLFGLWKMRVWRIACIKRGTLAKMFSRRGIQPAAHGME